MAQQSDRISTKTTNRPVSSSTSKPINRPASMPASRPVSATTSRQASGKSVSTPSFKTSNNAYKKGKLSKNARFSPTRINWTPIIIIACLILSIILALVFGNFLKQKAQDAQNTTPPDNSQSSIVFPDAEKVSPKQQLQGYFVDLSVEGTDENLSELTKDARKNGNALVINIKNTKNEIIYSSPQAVELGFEHKEALTLSVIRSHFRYYDEFAIAFFHSDFSQKLDTEQALKVQTNEILLLKEATDKAFHQIIVEFSNDLNKDNAINYQAYLLNLKLACPDVPVGIQLSQAFLSNPDNSVALAGILGIADFFTVDLGEQNADEIKASLSSLVYFTERYDSVVTISGADKTTLTEKLKVLSDMNITNYIVK